MKKRELKRMVKETRKALQSIPKNQRLFFEQRANYFVEYVNALQKGGTKLQRFAIEQINEANRRRNEAEKKLIELQTVTKRF